MGIGFSDLSFSLLCGFNSVGISALKREAEEELFLERSAFKSEAEDEFAVGLSAIKREAEEELFLEGSAVKREAEDELAVGASAIERMAEDESAVGVSAIEREAEEELFLEGSAVEREAEDEMAVGASVAKRDAEEELFLEGPAVKREAEDELAVGVSAVKREAEQELTLGTLTEGELGAVRNSAPSSEPCCHFTRASSPLMFFDSIKVNVLGRFRAFATLRRTPVRERSRTWHGRVNEPSILIHVSLPS